MAVSYIYFTKRILDVLIASIVLLILFPLLLLIGIGIKLDSRGPVLFKQARLGQNEKMFVLFKFRSMTHKNRIEHRQIFSGDIEVTKVGSFLRRTKMDELPQLFNVLLGQMSIVGPRPCLPEIKSKFGKFAKHRFSVKPGLTSLAAIKGSVYLTWDQKGIYDYIYVRRASFFVDLFIIVETIKVIFMGEKRMFSKNKNE